MYKTHIILLLVFFTSTSSFGQKKYLLWFMPSKAQKIYGITLNPWISEDNFSKKVSIYGGHLQFCPLAPFTILYNVNNIFRNDYFDSDLGNFDSMPPQEERKIIYGINLTCCDWGFSEVYGLDLNIGASEIVDVKGVSLSGIYNINTSINGLAISLICNKNRDCTGLEIGLINNSLKLRGLQIGLWNKNQKRSLPLLNWCFKK